MFPKFSPEGFKKLLIFFSLLTAQLRPGAGASSTNAEKNSGSPQNRYEKQASRKDVIRLLKKLVSVLMQLFYDLC